MLKNALSGLRTTCVCLVMSATPAAADTVTLYATDAATLLGHWTRTTDAAAAGGQRLSTPDLGWSSAGAPEAGPFNYVEFNFSAAANIPYRVWLRARAQNDLKWNDSVYLQFSDTINGSGSPVHRIGTTDALNFNLQPCNGCALSGWGWPAGAYWLEQATTVTFAQSGPHTLRVQTREDGVSVDQIVLSSSTYLQTRPGAESADNTIVRKPAPPAAGSTPFSGSPVPIPGNIALQDFDNGGQGVAYSDQTPNNKGGAYRQTGVDLTVSTDGGYCIGWTTAGEWVQYTVSVGAAGDYLVTFRVASSGQGGTFHLEMNGSNVTGPLTLPNTGGWQTWMSHSKVVTLTAGTQVARLVMDTNGPTGGIGNFTSMKFVANAPAPPLIPYAGVVTLPGIVQAENFDIGAVGTAYMDATPGNTGGAYRQTDVDIEAASEGGYNLGWTTAGEWLNYTVSVATSGSYIAQLRVASVGGGTMRVGFNGPSSVWQAVTIPNTGGWQNWITVPVPVTLGAGQQVMTLRFETAGLNLNYVNVVSSTPAPPPPGQTGTISVPAGGDLQAALDQARPGDTILLEAGATFVGNFLLPRKDGDAFITIRSSAPDALLPGANARMHPSYASLLPKLRSPNTAPAIRTAAAAHHYRLLFLELLANQNGAGDIIALGDGLQTTLAEVPHDLLVDRVYIHGDIIKGQKRGVALNSAKTTIVNSYIAEIKVAYQDSQAIAGWNGPGPYTITNNYLEAASENVIFGGDDPRIPEMVPSDITFTRNHLSKQLAWRNEPQWNVKNLFELKNAQRVLIDGNLMEYNWLAAQTGEAILFTPRNQYGGAPWTVVRDVKFTNNIVRHVGSGIAILGSDYIHPSQVTTNIVIRNNLFYDVSGQTYGGHGRFFLINGGVDITVDHNTVMQDGLAAIVADGTPTTNFVLTSNIVPDHSWAIIGTNTGPGNTTIGVYFPNSQILTGIFVGSDPQRYPPANFYPATMAEVGFVDAAGGNYRLSPTSIYRGAAYDGKDVGVDVDALEAAMR